MWSDDFIAGTMTNENYKFCMIKFRPHERSDVSFRVKWLNNKNANAYLVDDPDHVTTTEEQVGWFDRYEADENKRFFTICDETEPIGFLGLSNIDRDKKTASVFIVIGEDGYRGKGIGKIALNFLLEFGSSELGIQKYTLEVFKENIPAIRLYTSAGFVQVGEIDCMLCMELALGGITLPGV